MLWYVLGHSKQDDDVHCFCTLIDTNLFVDGQVTTRTAPVSNCFVIAKEVPVVYSSFLCLTSVMHETELVKSDDAVFKLYCS